jgi:2-polyprenyl-6-methoxyphenol hydroxylase-like FAD-dependent oxidoreductase
MPRPWPQSRVLIVGGGIGGLAVGIALGRRGTSVTLLERCTFADEVGAGIQLGPNATRALRQLGVLDAVEAAAFKPEAIWLFDAVSGRKLAAMPLGRQIDECYGAPYLTLHRADLHASLLAACRDHSSVELQEGFDVTAIETLVDTVVARAPNGTKVEGSSLIAADGLWSGVRQRIVPRAGLRFAGATAWRALLPRDHVPPPFDAPVVGLWLGSKAHLVHYPVRRGKDLNVVTVVEGGKAKQGWNRHPEQVELLGAFHRWAEPARALLEMVESWRCWSLYRLRPLRHWTKGRMALLGDAAHPVLPYLAQGAALAIEDAAALAASFEACGGDALLAFPRYEALRRHRIRRVQRHAARYGYLYHLRGPAGLARNLVLKHRHPESLLQGFDWLYGTPGRDE